MSTYTSNYGWTKPSGSDNVDISVLNGNLDDQDSTIHDAFLNMAPPFSESSTYAVDDIVLYGTGLYKCHTAVVTPGSWTGSTNWQVYKLSEGGSGGGGTSNYNQLTNKPQINNVELSGNKTTSELGIDKTAVGLGNVPNVATNDQTPTFTEASTRNNIASGEKLSVILGKVQKFFNDLKTVAFSGSYTDLTNKPNAEDIMLSDGVTSVEDALDGSKLTDITDWGENTSYPSGTALPTGSWIWIAHKVLPKGLYYITCVANLTASGTSTVSLYQRIRDLTHDSVIVSDSVIASQRFIYTSYILAITETTDIYLDVYTGGSASIYGRDFHAIKLF